MLAVLNRVIDLFTENVFRRLLTNDTPRNRLFAAAITRLRGESLVNKGRKTLSVKNSTTPASTASTISSFPPGNRK